MKNKTKYTRNGPGSTPARSLPLRRLPLSIAVVVVLALLPRRRVLPRSPGRSWRRDDKTNRGRRDRGGDDGVLLEDRLADGLDPGLSRDVPRISHNSRIRQTGHRRQPRRLSKKRTLAESGSRTIRIRLPTRTPISPLEPKVPLDESGWPEPLRWRGRPGSEHRLPGEQGGWPE